MVRQLTARPRTWTAALAILVAGGAIVWHILACTESPMAFSPDGKQLAFVTMEPYGGDEPQIADQHVFRLMVLGEDQKLRTLETTSKQMLSAPAYSPDGKHLCYVRIRQMTEAGWKQFKKALDERPQTLAPPDSKAWAEPATTQPGTAVSQAASSPATTGPAEGTKDLSLPSYTTIQETVANLMSFGFVPADLVVRDAKTDRIISTTSIGLTALGKDGPTGYFVTYATLRPQYSPDGKWIYLCAGNVVSGINPATGEQRIVSVVAPIAALSPDGETLAILAEQSIGFAQTDGSSALYKRWDKGISYSGLTWLDRRTVAVLEPAKTDQDPVRVHLLGQDGSIKRSITLDLKEPQAGKDQDAGELAIAPNGKNIVIAYEHDTYFLDAEGKLLAHWHHENDGMVQPTFSPDSSRVACKYMTEKGTPAYPRAAAIVFFTPDGKEQSRVSIPPADPPTTQPSQ